MTVKINIYANMNALSEAVSIKIMTDLANSLTKNGKASLMLSGGSTPKETYSFLGKSNFIWHHVDVGLVDERWVEHTSPGSNTAMLHQSFLSKPNVYPKFYPLKSTSDDLEKGCEIANLQYCDIFRPYTNIVLGMGLDGHTASWFPNAIGIQEALNPVTSNIVVPVRPQKSDVTGDYLERATLTLSAVNDSENVYLLISGQAKIDLFERILAEPKSKLPIRAAIDTLGDRLNVFWAP